jgi:NAD(P)-dependent dehydrogenase (short-subunit alcohol dehydrogenase family)
MAMATLRTFDDSVAIVTGGASGIGAALGRALAARGATVVLADRHHEAAAELATALRSSGGRAEAVELDVRDAEAFQRLVDDVSARHGRLDYLFNNAGTAVGGEVRDYTLDDWRYVVDVNLMGVIHGVQAAYTRMIQQGFGHIVNTASVAGLMATPWTTVYGTTKHAVVGLSRSLRIEAQVYGVRVSAICPGLINTPILMDGGRYGRTKVAVPAATQRAVWKRLRAMDPDRFAAQVLPRVARNQGIIIVPRWCRIVSGLNGVSPTLADALLHAPYRRLRKYVTAIAIAPTKSTTGAPH